MRTLCVGGGPAGLYTAIALKRQDPRHEVTVREQNPAGVTHGWGVVFWDDLLDEMHRVDPVSARAVRDAAVVWDGQAVQVGRRSPVFLGGSGYAIGRHRLLTLLGDRAHALGVDVRFSTPAPEELLEHDTLPGGPDSLVVAADGAGSRLRRHYADEFGTRLEPGRNRYLWLGTPALFSTFTFGFVDTGSGWILVPRLPLRRAHQHVHRRGPAGHLGRAGPRPPRHRCLPEHPARALRPGAARGHAARRRGHGLHRAVADLPPGHQRALVQRPRRAGGRRRAHHPLRDRLGHEARPGRCHRTGRAQPRRRATRAPAGGAGGLRGPPTPRDSGRSRRRRPAAAPGSRTWSRCWSRGTTCASGGRCGNGAAAPRCGAGTCTGPASTPRCGGCGSRPAPCGARSARVGVPCPVRLGRSPRSSRRTDAPPTAPARAHRPRRARRAGERVLDTRRPPSTRTSSSCRIPRRRPLTTRSPTADPRPTGTSR